MIDVSLRPTDYDVPDFVRVANELVKKLNKPLQFKVPMGISYAHAFQKAWIYGKQLKPEHFKKEGARCISKKAKNLLDEVYGINEDSIRQLIQSRSGLTQPHKQENEKMSPTIADKIANKVKNKKADDVDEDLDFEDDEFEDDSDDIEFEEDDEDEDVTPKRGPGRPKKQVPADEGEEDDEDEDDTPKRGPGRPKKSGKPGTPKRGPGRPKKQVPDDDDDADEDGAPKKAAPAKQAKIKTGGDVPPNVIEAIGTILAFLKL